ncbi:hypothetical protein KBD61_00395 [Patescibacteria group bacterium]|nr:hypothetical protein [Patescibacteria group bacterium]MBP9709468.1 hypothetical protein [Patescibacteria group bacterium]
MRRLPLLVSFFGLALFGFGCKEPSYQANTVTNWRGAIQDPGAARKPSSPIPPKVTQKRVDTVQPLPAEVPVLRQALTNLGNANSFKATLTLPPADGQTTPVQGSLLFDRARGFRGSITLNAQAKSDILSINGQVYFRANTSTWQAITYTEEGDRLQAFFQVAFPNKSKPNQLLVSDSTRILEVADDSRGCKRYVYTEILPTGDTAKTTLCIKNGFPAYIINEYAEGATEVSYSEINEPVNIGGLDS